MLDCLRGVAAMTVLIYHVFEGHQTCPQDQVVNHGYLAVDFFFMLSGFVLAYAYGRDRAISSVGFIQRRIIRLHPMVLIGVILGIVSYLIQGCVRWDGMEMAGWTVAVAAMCNMVMLPVIPGTQADVRGNNEMFPLNGPHWSLFFEYIASLAYALILRRLSTRVIIVIAAISGLCLAILCIGDILDTGCLGVGWSLSNYGLAAGLLRVTFPFTIGMLLARCFKSFNLKGIFIPCSLILVSLLIVPYVGDAGTTWMNGLYEMACLSIAFPLIIGIAAGATVSGKTARVMNFLGAISFPLYAIHYPVMYLYYAKVWNEEWSFAQSWPYALIAVASSILLAWVFMKYYDTPVRRIVSGRFLTPNHETV